MPIIIVEQIGYNYLPEECSAVGTSNAACVSHIIVLNFAVCITQFVTTEFCSRR